VRKSKENYLLRKTLPIFIYFALFFILTRLFAYLIRLTPIVSEDKYYSLIVIFFPLIFLLYSLSSLLFARRMLRLFDSLSYLLILPEIFLLLRWQTLEDPYLVQRFVYLLIAYMKIIPFLIYYFKELIRAKDFYKDRRLNYTCFVISLLFFAGLTFLDIHTRDLSGDEPHYLIAAHSLLNDFDFDLVNNYRARDYLRFYPHFLSSRNADESRGLKMLTQLGFGFPLLLAPGYAVLGRLGAQLTLDIITAILIVNILNLVIALSNSERGVMMVFLTALFSSSYLIYSRAIYPEMFIALLVFYLMGLILTKSRPDFKFNSAMLFLSFVLVLTKIKTVFPVLILVVLSIYKFTSTRRRFFKILSVVFILGGYLPLFDYYILGNIFYSKIAEYIVGFFTHPPAGLLGLLFDQESGLLISAPIFLIAVVEVIMVLLGWKDAERGYRFLLVFLASNYAFVGFWKLWHGLSTPAPRYLIPVLPFFLIFLARAWEKRHGFLFALMNFAFIVFTVLYGFLINLVPAYWYNWCDGSNTLLENVGKFAGMYLTSLLPSFLRGSSILLFQMLWIVGFLFFVTYFLCKKGHRAESLKLNSKGKYLFYSGLLFFPFLFSMVFFCCGSRLPTYIVEVEDLDSGLTGDFIRYPLQKDPWYGGRYMKGEYDNGLICYPGQEVDIDVNLKSANWTLYLYGFAEKNDRQGPVLLLSFDAHGERKLQIEKGDWGECLVVKPEKPIKFSTVSIKNITDVLDAAEKDNYGVVIDKLVFEYL